MKPIRHSTILIGLSLALVFMMGCGLVDQAKEQVTNKVGEIANDAVEKALEGAEGLDVEEMLNDAGEMLDSEPLENEVSTDTGLDELQSYRVRFTMAAIREDGSEDTQKEQLTVFKEVVRSQDAVHVQLVPGTIADLLSTQGVEYYQFEDRMYILNNKAEAEDRCVVSGSADSPDNPAGIMAVEKIFPEFEVGDLIEEGVEINGVKTDHYQVKRIRFLIGARAASKADVWIAQQGQYVVRFVGEMAGIGIFSDKSGALRLKYNLLDINGVPNLEVPAECAGKEAEWDLPLPDSAEEISYLGSTMTYKSPEDTDAVAAFYREEMAADGWSLDNENKLEGVYTYDFTQVDRKVTVLISPNGEKGSTVLITGGN